VGQILDIFGTYVRSQPWRSSSSDIRNEVFRRYEEVLSPARCRDLWDEAGRTVANADSSEERDQGCSEVYAKRIVELQSYVDAHYAAINAAFGSNSQGFPGCGSPCRLSRC
jgi:hypothetical protein